MKFLRVIIQRFGAWCHQNMNDAQLYPHYQLCQGDLWKFLTDANTLKFNPDRSEVLLANDKVI